MLRCEGRFAIPYLLFSGMILIVRQTRSALDRTKTSGDLPGPLMLPDRTSCSLEKTRRSDRPPRHLDPHTGEFQEQYGTVETLRVSMQRGSVASLCLRSRVALTSLSAPLSPQTKDSLSLRRLHHSREGNLPDGKVQVFPGHCVVQVHVGKQRCSHCSLRCTDRCLRPLTIFRNSRLQPFLDQAKYPAIGPAMLDELHPPLVAHVVEEAPNVPIEHPVHSLPLDARRQRVQRWMGLRPGETIREAFESTS